jgi:hypothetical protein
LSRDRDTATAGVKAKPSGGPRPALTPAQPGEREEREERVDPTRQQADHQQRVSSSPPRRSHGRGKPVVPSPWQATRSRPPLSPLAAVADDTVDLSDGSSSIPLRARSSHSGRADRPQLGRSSGLSRVPRDRSPLTGFARPSLVGATSVTGRSRHYPWLRLNPAPAARPRCGSMHSRIRRWQLTQPTGPFERCPSAPKDARRATRGRTHPETGVLLSNTGGRHLDRYPGWPSTTRSMKGGPRTVRPNGSRVLDRH